MLKFQQGQSFIELIVALGLISLVLTIVTTTTLSSIRASQFSRDQIQATQLAKQGFEKVRTIKDRNYLVCPSPNSGTNRWNDLWTNDCHSSGPCNYALKTSSNSCTTPGGGTLPGDLYWLSTNSTPNSDTAILDNVTFTRTVSITDYYDPTPPGSYNLNQKEVTIKVTWTDLTGDHTSQLTSIIANVTN